MLVLSCFFHISLGSISFFLQRKTDVFIAELDLIKGKKKPKLARCIQKGIWGLQPLRENAKIPGAQYHRMVQAPMENKALSW